MENGQLIRGLFTSPEIEKCLWECVWLDWQRMANASIYEAGHRKRLPKGLAIIAKRLSLSLDTKFNQAWLTRCVEGEFISERVIDLLEGEKYALVSLSKFRGGRAEIGPFKGYLNPGEALYLEGKAEGQVLTKADKVTSGERIILNLMLRNSDDA